MSVTDNFEREDEYPLANGVWTTQTGASGAMRIVSNQAKGYAGAANVSYYSGTTFANDQYSQCKVPTPADGGPTLRNASAAYTYYAFVVRTTLIQFGKRVAGNWTQVGSSYTYSVGATEVVKLEAVGTTFTLYIDGVSKTSWTDASISAGYAGIQCYGTVTILDDWEGGDVGGGGGGGLIAGSWMMMGIGL